MKEDPDPGFLVWETVAVQWETEAGSVAGPD